MTLCGRAGPLAAAFANVAARKAALLPLADAHTHGMFLFEHKVWRLMLPVVAVAACGGLAWTAAASISESPLERVTVTPARGAPATTFTVSFRTSDRTGPTTGIYETLSGNATSMGLDCVTNFNVRTPAAAAGAKVRVTLNPRRLGGSWCLGSYSGRITEIQTSSCSTARLCPLYLLSERELGTFRLRVHTSTPLLISVGVR